MPSKKHPKFKSKFEAEIYSQLPSNFEYEIEKIPYVLVQEYTPDFTDKNSNLVIEAKGYFDAAARRKMLAVKNQNPEKRICIVFQSDNRISKKSKTTYSQWAEKNGFEYSIGVVPKEWKNTKSST